MAFLSANSTLKADQPPLQAGELDLSDVEMRHLVDPGVLYSSGLGAIGWDPVGIHHEHDFSPGHWRR